MLSRPVAPFRTFDGVLYAIDDRDPFGWAFARSRGMVGTRGAVATVAVPAFRQVAGLRTGERLSRPGGSVTVHEARCVHGVVGLGSPRPDSP